MKYPLALVVALTAALALPAAAQDLSLSGESSAPLTSAEGDVNAGAPLDAQITGDNSYKSLTDAINANEAVDLSAVTDESQVKIVLVSTLEGDAAAEGALLDEALSAQASALTTLRTDVSANAVITGKLDAEGYTAEDVIAVRSDADGSTIVYVDDRE
jgi:hypothetical protein